MIRSALIISLLMLSLAGICFAGELDLGNYSVNVSSYIQVKYNNSEASTDQFTIPRARFDLWGNIGTKSAYFIEIDAASTQPLVYSWIEYKLDEKNKLTMGRMFYPFSLEYMTTPNNFETILPTSMLWAYFGYSRDIGLMASGKYETFKYYGGIVNGSDYSYTDDNETKDIVGRFVYYPIKDLGIGVSYYNGRSGTLEAYKVIGGGEISYSKDSFSVKSEYYAGENNSIHSRGWYFQPSYYVLNGVQLLIKYEDWDPDVAVANNSLYTTTYGVNWFFDTTTKLMVNYIANREETTPVVNDELLAQMQLSF